MSRLLRTSYLDILRTSAKHILRTLEGYKRTSSRRRKWSSLEVKCRTLWGRPQDIALGRPQDVIIGSPQNGGKGCSLALDIKPYGAILRTYFVDVLRTLFAEWDSAIKIWKVYLLLPVRLNLVPKIKFDSISI